MAHETFDDGHLECAVTNPRKENDGSKDAYVSYLVTTKTDFKTFQVGRLQPRNWVLEAYNYVETGDADTAKIHRLCLPVQHINR
jgi:hypothetical protein